LDLAVDVMYIGQTSWRSSRDSKGAAQGCADERLVPDLSRGRGRSVGGDLYVGEEGSK
jgi:hypothetical protein